MLSSRATRNLATSLLLTAAGVAVGLLWAARRQPAHLPLAVKEMQPALVRVLAPVGSDSFDEPVITAQPHDASYRLAGADDYEALSPDELSSAFLARATESWSELEGGEMGDADLDGFQIATIQDLTIPELHDDPADFEIPGERTARS